MEDTLVIACLDIHSQTAHTVKVLVGQAATTHKCLQGSFIQI